MSCGKSQSPTLLGLLTERRKVVPTLAVFQIYIHAFLQMDQELAQAERATTAPFPRSLDVGWLEKVETACNLLNFDSSLKQIARIRRVVAVGAPVAMAPLLQELRTRFNEDAENCAFYAIVDPAVLLKFFTPTEDPAWQGCLIRKSVVEIFDAKIVLRFPEMEDDLHAAVDCFIYDCFTASTFHLMRVIEFSLMRTAKLAEIPDPKPSWGAVLEQLDKIAFRTKYADLSVGVKPHREFIKTLIPKMQAIQHAWRNKIDHVGYKLIPAGEVGGKVAADIMSASGAFLSTLAADFPDPTILQP
jgi:hypothetical protein